MNLESLLDEIINEASTGKIIIDHEEYNIGFNTKINNHIISNNENNDLTLIIHNKEIFLALLNEYLNAEISLSRKNNPYLQDKKELNKLLITTLFVNATTEDLANPELFIKKYLSFLKDTTLSNIDNKEINLNEIFPQTNLLISIKKQSIYMETPYKITFRLIDKTNPQNYFDLPEISYGIEENNCYIYSILNKENKNIGSESSIKYKKMINRKLYTLNESISLVESQEFKDYQNGLTDYYPENITDISVSAVLSLNIFLNLIKDKISLIKVVPYLPIRYNSRYISALETTNSKLKDEKNLRNDNIQYNATNKLIRTMNRVAATSDTLLLYSNPYELDEYLTYKITNNDKLVSNQTIEKVNHLMK